MNLGKFSVCLAVKDLAQSRSFYEKLGFQAMPGFGGQKWAIFQNRDATIGLFEGALPGNMLCFNPGWDISGTPLKEFADVRELQKAVKASGLALATEADENSRGPASFVLTDPDGNLILVDQHV